MNIARKYMLSFIVIGLVLCAQPLIAMKSLYDYVPQKGSNLLSKKNIVYTVMATAGLIGVCYLGYKFFYQDNKPRKSETVKTFGDWEATCKPACEETEQRRLSNPADESPMLLRAETPLEETDYSVKRDQPISPVAGAPIKSDTFKTFWDWKSACEEAEQQRLSNPVGKSITPLTAEMLLEEIRFFNEKMAQELSVQSNWIDGRTPNDEFLKSDEPVEQFYLQKVEVPIDSENIFHGDVHGDVISLNEFIEDLYKKGYTDPSDPFKIIKPKTNLFFLGDYVDRGDWGAEVIYTILRLKKANPDKVFLVRGNHEDIGINCNYGFIRELRSKFGDSADELIDPITKLYTYLPVASSFVSGNNALICCHGGLEIGSIKPKELLEAKSPVKYTLLGKINHKACIKSLEGAAKEELERLVKRELEGFVPDEYDQQTPTRPFPIGFLWNDFQVSPLAGISYVFGRGLKLGKLVTTALLKLLSTPTCAVRGVLRAHQHGDREMMLRIKNSDGLGHKDDAGVGKLWIEGNTPKEAHRLWDGIVCTFSVCPRSTYGESSQLQYDSYGILKTAERYEDWRLTVHRTEVKKLR